MTTKNIAVLSRRSFLAKISLASTGIILADVQGLANSLAQKKPNSKFAGVQIGTITYSFRSMPGDIVQILQYITDSGINAVELMGDALELYVGKPVNADKNEVAKWRSEVDMSRFKEIKRLFDKAGVSVYAYKQPDALTFKSTDAEIDYVMKVAKVLGATSVTLELPQNPEHTDRLGRFATKHKMYIGYHTHTQATDTIWDTALQQSPYNSINLDCGHYIAAGGQNTKASLLAFIETNHKRITSMHMKDRRTKEQGGANLPWGMGDTPIKEILLLIKNKKYNIPVSIELEYKIPEGSDAVKEVRKCVAYAKSILK